MKVYILCGSIYIKYPEEKNLWRESRLMLDKCWGRGWSGAEMGGECKWVWVSFGGDENVLKSIVMLVAQL